MAATSLQSGVGLDSKVREDIYRQLRSRGLPEWLKSQLRCRLVRELQAPPPPPASVEHQRAAPLCQLVNDLILDHFRCLKYHCSRSVFTAEYADKVLSVDQLLSCLHVPEGSSLALTVRESQSSVLVVLLLELAGQFTRRSLSRESACQTDTDSRGSLLAHKLLQLDGESSNFLSPGSGHCSVDEQLAAHQHRCEERARTQVKQEVARIRKVELAQMRLAERESHDRELAKTRNQLHAEYSERLKHLKQFELRLHEQFRSKEEELEASVFKQRQALLREMDSVRNREALSLRSVAVSRETLSGEAARVESLLEEVRKKEASIQQAQQEYQRLAEETTYQFERKARETALQHQEELRRGQVALKELQCEVERLEGCIHESQAERSSLLGRLRAATEQLDETARQRDSLQKRQVCLGDSPEASVRIADLQRQVQTLQEQLQSSRLQGQQREEELKKSLEEMAVKLTMPSAELMVLKAEQKREREVWREQLCSLTRERDCLQKAVGILKRRSDDTERQLQERDLQLLHHIRELEDAKAQIAVLERAVDGWVRRGSSLAQGKKGRGSSPVGKKVLRFASPVRTHILPNNTSASPKKGPLMQVGGGPPLSQLDTRSVMMRLDQVAKDLDQSYSRMIDTSSVASESDHLSLLSPGSPLPPVDSEQPAVRAELSTAGETRLERQESKATKWPLSLDTLWQGQHHAHRCLEHKGVSLDPVPPIHTTEPTLPISTTEPTPPIHTTEPTPPIHTTEPTPPIHTTGPTPPIHTTGPTPPIHTTEPTPPIHTTEPTPPIHTTEPTPPIHTTEPTPPIHTTGPTPPIHTTGPTPPIHTTEPTPPIHTTGPTPPIHTTEPTPPIHTTEPTPPIHTTEPTPPIHTTEPTPPISTIGRNDLPVSTDHPALPIKNSDPAPPISAEDPAPPINNTDPAPPTNTTNSTLATNSPKAPPANSSTGPALPTTIAQPAPAPCTIVSSNAPPSWEVLHSQREQERQQRRLEQEAACRAELAELGGLDKAEEDTSPSPRPEAVVRDEVPNPVMQRYMQLVVEQQQEAFPTTPRPEVGGGSQGKVDEFGLPLSADEHGSFGGASSGGDDPFEDW